MSSTLNSMTNTRTIKSASIDEDWKLYGVYFELSCPFDHQDFDKALENDNDAVYDGMDFMVTENRKSKNYGYWFFIRSSVIDSFKDYIWELYGSKGNVLKDVEVDYESFLVRRSSGRTNFKFGKYL